MYCVTWDTAFKSNFISLRLTKTHRIKKRRHVSISAAISICCPVCLYRSLKLLTPEVSKKETTIVTNHLPHLNSGGINCSKLLKLISFQDVCSEETCICRPPLRFQFDVRTAPGGAGIHWKVLKRGPVDFNIWQQRPYPLKRNWKGI